MPLALIVALVASLGVHALALFVPDIELSAVPEPSVLTAELQPLPKALPPAEPSPKRERKPPLAKPGKSHHTTAPQTSATPVLSMPPAAPATDLPQPAPAVATEPDPPQPAPNPELLPTEARLPARGTIRYRVDRGERGFELGRSTHDWAVVDGHYRITAVTETSGLAALIKPLRVEVESRGKMTAAGLQPEHFVIRRDGKVGHEQADFDWDRMLLRIGGQDSNTTTQSLTPGAQDLLSFHYQMGFLPHPEANNSLPIATGKKYTTYRLEAVGDEQIEIPAGVFRTLHLRAPGDNTTELWLAYDYLLLPVKIRHLDRHGDSFVEVATEILLSKE